MNKKTFQRLFVGILLVLLILPMVFTTINAKNKDVYGCHVYVDDLANLLTNEEENQLIEDITKYCEGLEFNVLFLTTNDTGCKDTETYSDDYMDNLFPVDQDENNIGFIIDMDNRQIYVNTMGGAITVFTDKKVERILDAGYKHIKRGEYYECLSGMGTYAMKRLQRADPEGGDPKFGHGGFTTPIIDIIEEILYNVSDVIFDFRMIIVSAIATLIYFFVKKHDHTHFVDVVNTQHYSADYKVLNKSNDKVDSRRKIIPGYYAPTTSSSGGHGGGGGSFHSSSSGRSHGGGGRSF